jgi:retinol dehydrogenase 12
LLIFSSPVFNVFFARQLSTLIASSKLVVTVPCPGLCKSELRREATKTSTFFRLLEKSFEWIMFTSEQGSRNFVFCALTDRKEDVHGQFVQLSQPREVADFVLTETGQETQKKVWVSRQFWLCVDDMLIWE